MAACPTLTPLVDDSFGSTTLKLIEVANQYRECREAALAGAGHSNRLPGKDSN